MIGIEDAEGNIAWILAPLVDQELVEKFWSGRTSTKIDLKDHDWAQWEAQHRAKKFAGVELSLAEVYELARAELGSYLDRELTPEQVEVIKN